MDIKPYLLTYFLVEYNKKNFSFEDFCGQIGLDVQETKDNGAENEDDDIAYIYIGYNYDFNENLNVLFRESIKNLIGKEDILVKLKEKYNLKYTLERAPTVSNNYRLDISLEEDIIAFLYKSQSKDDIDYFIE